MSISLKRLHWGQSDFLDALAQALMLDAQQADDIEDVVRRVLRDVRDRGDAALLEYTRRFDRLDVADMRPLVADQTDLKAAFERIPAAQQEALKFAAERVREYAEHQKLASWEYVDALGNRLGQKVTPVDRAGVYVPGGKAAYPSSVLMNAIPAHVAGVGKIVMTTPTPDGVKNDMVLAAAYVAGVDLCVFVGGAQAIAALAYGTETVPAVDKIVGPGNIFVATAKRQVFGQVGIDMVAGPSEVLVITDGSADPDWVAMDLFAQAEHDEIAQSIVVTTSEAHLQDIEASIARLLPDMERAEIIRASLSGRGLGIVVPSLTEAAQVSNFIAPEHLELGVESPEALLAQIHHAGAVFVGHYSAEVFGDYCAGPNHVLPTARTARFASPLGVYDFQKRSTIVACSESGVQVLARQASVLARGEGLTAHARSAEYRIKS